MHIENSAVSYCYHCGDDCKLSPIVFDEHHFCCHGCKAVYEILNSNNMSGYYTLNDSPGTKPTERNETKYSFLENNEIANRFYTFQNDDIRRVNLFLPEIHCSSCIWLLENLYKVHNGVLNSEVNFLSKRCTISFNISKLSLKELAVLLDKIGYPPRFESPQSSKRKTNYKFVGQLAVAGFVFGNIMLMSFPEYLSTDDSFAKDFRPFFSYFILALSIPVLLYSLQDYIISAFKAIRAKTLNLDVPITLGIFSLYARSLYDILAGNGPGYMDSFAGFAFFLLVGKWFQNKTYEALSFERDYKSYFPLAVTRIRDNSNEMIPIENIEIDDLLLVRNEEIIPTDAVIVSGNGQIDYSFVTGESNIIQKKKNDDVFAGGKQMGNAIKIKVSKKVEQSYLTDLWNQKLFSKTVKDSLTEWTDKLSFYFISVILALAIISAIVWYYIDASQTLNVVISVLIVACPCALALAIPFTFGNAIRIAGAKKMYIKNPSIVEQLGKVTDIVFDKTGTITYNKMSDVNWHGDEMVPEDIHVIYWILQNSMHPLSVAIKNKLQHRAGKEIQIEHYTEAPGRGLMGSYKGEEYKIGSLEWIGLPTDSKDVLETRVYFSKSGLVLGYYKIQNAYRREFKEIAPLLSGQYGMHLLSGDNEGERKYLQEYFHSDHQMHFNQSPMDKLTYIQRLKSKDKTVMMLGDGLNDAGALKESDVGVVVSDNVHNFSPASDAILSSSRLNLLIKMLKLGKFSIKLLKWSYAFSFTYNIIGLYFAFTNQLTPLVAAILMPLSSISIVVLTTIAMKMFERRSF